jgi:hypothetical protein
MSGDAAGWKEVLADVFVQNLQRYVIGAPLANVVDKNLGFVSSSQT